MKFTVIALVSLAFGEGFSKVIFKRGIYGEGGHSLGVYNGGISGGLALGAAHAQLISRHITIANKIALPVAQPYPVHVEKAVPVPVPHPVSVPIDQPYVVKVPHPVAVPIEKPIAVPIESLVPVPIAHNVPYPVSQPVAVPVSKPIAVPVYKDLLLPIPHPVAIHKPFLISHKPLIIPSGLGHTEHLW